MAAQSLSPTSMDEPQSCSPTHIPDQFIRKRKDNDDEHANIFDLLHDLTSRTGGVLDPSSHYAIRFNEFFTISFLISMATDPLFFFVLYVNTSKKCILVDVNLAILLTIIRSLTDFVYLIHILLEFRTGYIERPIKKDSWWPLERSRKLHASPGDLVSFRPHIASNYVRRWFLLDFLSVLPLPQIILWIVLPLTGFVGITAFNTFVRVSVLLQSIPRLIRLVPYLSGSYKAKGFIFELSSANFVLNLIVYLVVAHVIGCMWYLYAIDRIGDCFTQLCSSPPCDSSFFDCTLRAPESTETSQWRNGTIAINNSGGINVTADNILDTCVFALENGGFDFGIYSGALAITHNTSIYLKYIYSFFWGFQQLTTFTGNQMPTEYLSETLFATFVALFGLLLFTLLIGNIQGFLVSLNRRTFEYQLRRRDVDDWMGRNFIDYDIQNEVRNYERLQWHSSEGIDDSSILQDLPHDLQRKIYQEILQKLIRNSVLLSVMEERVLHAMCHKFKKEVFLKGGILLQQGLPITQVFFIERGQVSSRKVGGVLTNAIAIEVLGNGSCLGEELLLQIVESFSPKLRDVKSRMSGTRQVDIFNVHTLPLSERTIVCLKETVCYSLEVSDLLSICKQYQNTFNTVRMTKVLNELSYTRKHHAATTIQVRWRAYWRRTHNLSIQAMHDVRLRSSIGSSSSI